MGFDPRQRRADVLREYGIIESPTPPPSTTTTKGSTTMTNTEESTSDIDAYADEQATIARAERMAFTRSTTKTTVHRDAEGNSEINVEHIARFTIDPGFVEDLTTRYGVRVFRTTDVVVVWKDGKLHKVTATGPRVLKSGAMSDVMGVGHGPSYEWDDDWRTKTLDRAALPHNIERRIADYEAKVAVAASGSMVLGGE